MKSEINNLPKISIVIPSYNKVDYIEATLASIFDQKYPNLEVIIQDGGSTDGSLQIIQKFAGKYPGKLKWVSKKDGGQVEAINTGLKKASGEVLAYINADDIYSPGSFEATGRSFQQIPKTLWLTGFGDIVDEKGNKKSQWVTKYKNFLLRLNHFMLLLMVNYITQSSTFFSKKAYRQYGPFLGTDKFVMEYDLWLKLASVKMPVVIKKKLSSFRLTPNNISATSFKVLLALDYKIARSYTKNRVVLLFHYLHNLARISLISLTKLL